MGKTYRVKYTEEPEGGWMVQIPGNPGGVNCVSWGKSIRAAREMIRDALALCLEDDRAAAEAEFDEYIRPPSEVRDEVAALRKEREQIEALQESASMRIRQVARALAERGMTVRDAAEVMGVSYQRVQQLLAEEVVEESKSARKRPRASGVRRARGARTKEPQKRRA